MHPPAARDRLPDVLRELDLLVRAGQQPADPDPALAYADATTWLARATACLRRLERAGHSDAEIRALAADLRSTAAASPFMRRIQSWPRGYPGDFETVEQIVDGRVDAAPHTFAWHLERVVLDTAMVAQHRNKIAAQARHIAACTRQRPDAAILALACGGARDFVHAQASLHPDTTVVLNDTDPAALSLAHQRLADRCQLHREPGHAVRCVQRLAAARQFDLILIGGLFDYLPDRALARILAVIHTSLLRPGGLCLFTNIAAGNRFRPLMHHLVDWPLIERDEAGLAALWAGLGRPADRLSITREATGLTLLATIAQ